MIRDNAARYVARLIRESAAPEIVSDVLVDMAATIIKNAVATDETRAECEALEAEIKTIQARPLIGGK